MTFSTNIADALLQGGAFKGPYGFGPHGHDYRATVIVTARFNPFYGMIAGIIVKAVFFGL